MNAREGALNQRVAVFALLDLLGAGLSVLLILGVAKLQEMHAKLDSADGTSDTPYMAFAWSLCAVVAVAATVSVGWRLRSGGVRSRILRILDIARWALVAGGLLFIAAGFAVLASM